MNEDALAPPSSAVLTAAQRTQRKTTILPWSGLDVRTEPCGGDCRRVLVQGPSAPASSVARMSEDLHGPASLLQNQGRH